MRKRRNHLIELAVAVFCAGSATAVAQDAAGVQTTALRHPIKLAVAAQPIAAALNDFARQSGLHVVIGSDIAKGVTSAPIDGMFTPDAALTRLLANTGLRYEYLDARTVAILSSVTSTLHEEARPAAEQYVNTSAASQSLLRLAQSATASGSAASNAASQSAPAGRSNDLSSLEEIDVVTVYGRGAQDQTVRDVPQSLTVFNPELIEVISGPNVDDVIRLLPSTNNLLGDFSFGNNFNVRGSPVSFTYNGMIPTLTTPSRIGMTNVERVEVLMGPSSITYGSMAPGAVVNIVTKQPTREFYSQLKLQAGSFDTYGGSFDVGGPLGERVRARLNASYADRGAPVDHWQQQTTFLAPVVAFDLSDRTLLTLEGTYHRVNHPKGIYDGRIPTPGTLRPNPNGQIPLSTNTAYFAGVTQQTDTYRDASLRLTHTFSDALTLNAQVAWADAVRLGVDGFGGALGPDNRTLARGIYPRDQGSDSYTVSMNLASAFDTGPITHRLIAGVDYLVSEAYGKSGQYFPTVGTVARFDVYSPDYSMTQPLMLSMTTDSRSETNNVAAFFQERATIGNFSLVAGARYTDSEAERRTTALTTGVVTRPRDTVAQEWSKQLGALYNITSAWTIYGSYNTSFLPRSPVLLRNGSFFTEPETARQYEAGTRYVFPSETALSLAVYQIVKPNALTRDPVDINFFIPAGELTSEGVEISLSGRPMPGLTALVSYGYNPTEVTKSTTVGQQGLEFQNAPKQTGSVVARYDFESGALNGLSLSAVVNYVGMRFAEATNQLALPAYTRVDLGLHYRLSDAIELSLQGNNLTDRDIYSGFQTTLIARNPGPNYMFSVQVTPGNF